MAVGLAGLGRSAGLGIPVLAAFVLAMVVGTAMSVAAYRVLHPNRKAGSSVLLAGVLSISCVSLQSVLLREFSWLQLAFWSIGLVTIWAGRKLLVDVEFICTPPDTQFRNELPVTAVES
ncbi:hypothetical protein [Rhodococcus sovatensis]|uniref:Uncharacterized protein n=1 Tax=Rhodococcus sovatensis TaxID=1805840 RepID=A0ABZ2PKB8_9NOCA